MGKHRTKEQKIIAQLKRHLQQTSAFPRPQYVAPARQTSPSYIAPLPSLPSVQIKSDLLKTVTLTILALLVQVGLAYYLQHRGWNQLKHLLAF